MRYTSEQRDELRTATRGGRITKVGAQRVSWYTCPACLSNFKEGEKAAMLYGELLHSGYDVRRTNGSCWNEYQSKKLAEVISEPWHYTSDVPVAARKLLNRQLEAAASNVAVDRATGREETTYGVIHADTLNALKYILSKLGGDR